MILLIFVLLCIIWMLTGMLYWILDIVEFKGAFHRREMDRDSIIKACLLGPLPILFND